MQCTAIDQAKPLVAEKSINAWHQRQHGADKSRRTIAQDLRVITKALRVTMGVELIKIPHPTKGRGDAEEFRQHPYYYVLHLVVCV